MLNPHHLRASTPACQSAINLNNASTSYLDQAVAARMERYRAEELARGRAFARDAAREELNLTRASVGLLIGAAPEEIAFLDTATRAWATALRALVRLQPGDRMLMARGEWAGNRLNALAYAVERQARVEIIPSEVDGTVSLDRLAALLDQRVRAVLVPLVQTNNGLIQPVAEIGQLLRERLPDCTFLVDGSQAVGQVPVDLATLGADALVFPSRKWVRGPSGVAVLAIRRARLAGLLTGALIDRHGFVEVMPGIVEPDIQEAARFESHEFDAAARLGLAMAARAAIETGLHAVGMHTASWRKGCAPCWRHCPA